MLVPADFSFVDITGSSVGVTLEEPKESNVIKRYEAYIKGGRPEQTCTIEANEDPLVCTISGLSPARAYTVGLKACVHGSNGCGATFEKSPRTG